jgi:D-inositol-3-phosphate glycosyltransferase
MLLFVGRIEPLKGIDTLLEAIAILRAKQVYMCLSVIGGEPTENPEIISAEMARLQDIRQQYGLTDLVTFLGKRGQDTLPYYYSAAEAVVVPSHYESFGMVALEAMACGTPVVASEVGGLAFLVQDGVTGFTFPVDEAQALADRLQALLQDRDLRQRMGAQAASFAQQYGWGEIAARMQKVYQGLLLEKDEQLLPAD